MVEKRPTVTGCPKARCCIAWLRLVPAGRITMQASKPVSLLGEDVNQRRTSRPAVSGREGAVREVCLTPRRVHWEEPQSRLTSSAIALFLGHLMACR